MQFPTKELYLAKLPLTAWLSIYRKRLYGCLLLCTASSLRALMAQSQPFQEARLQTLMAITKQVWRTFPDTRLQPTVQLVATKNAPLLASFKPKPRPTIFFNERLYELCQSFESDSLTALAIVIGHELVHYHANHKDWLELAQDKRADPTNTAPLLTDVERTSLEALADREGTLHAYLAGYDAFRLIQPLYERIYKTYPLQDNLPAYPTKAKRIELTRFQVNSARQHALLVDAAGFLFALGNLDWAEPCLTTAVQQWPLPELQNNLAAVYIRQALRLTKCQEMPFQLPVEWNTFNRLLLLRQPTAETEAEKEILLEQALTYAQQAQRATPDAPAVLTNLAIIHLLAKRFGTVDDLTAQVIKTAPNPNARLIKAIGTLYRTRNLTGSLSEFEKIMGSANEAFNRRVVAAWPTCLEPARPDTTKTDSSVPPEPGLGIYKLPFSAAQLFPTRTAVEGTQRIDLNAFYDEEKQLELIRLQQGAKLQYQLLKTTASTWPTARGLRVGQSEDTVAVVYGPPDQRIELNTETRIYHYKQAGLLVSIRNGLVSQLLIYRQLSPLSR